jgi:hypothetical protein
VVVLSCGLLLFIMLIIMTAPPDEVDHDLIDDSFMSLRAPDISLTCWLLVDLLLHNSNNSNERRKDCYSKAYGSLLI